jgi:hypothetical protein
MPDDGAQCQTELTVRRQQGVAGHLWMPMAITQAEVGQDGEPSTTRGALDAADGDPTQMDTEVMRMMTHKGGIPA